MAEILGTVASGLAVAEVGLKVGGTVWKLKKLWQEVHQVPATIQDLMRQIEMMDPILSDYETILGIGSTAIPIQPPTHNGAPATQSAAYCREALNDLRRLVEDLDVAVESERRSRRTVARMKAVLKKDTVKGFQDRLEKAMRLLQWSQMNYLAWVPVITSLVVAGPVLMSIQNQRRSHGSHGHRHVDRCNRHAGPATTHIATAQNQQLFQLDRKTTVSSHRSRR